MDEPLEGTVVNDATVPYCPHSNITTFYNGAIQFGNHAYSVLQICEECGNKTYLGMFDLAKDK